MKVEYVGFYFTADIPFLCSAFDRSAGSYVLGAERCFEHWVGRDYGHGRFFRYFNDKCPD